MLQKPKHFPVYVAIYLVDGKINKEITMITKVTKSNDLSLDNKWRGTPIKVLNLDYESIYKNDIGMFKSRLGYEAYLLNNLNDAIFVSKDEWNKAVKKANKLIDEANKQGANIKRIPY